MVCRNKRMCFWQLLEIWHTDALLKILLALLRFTCLLLVRQIKGDFADKASCKSIDGSDACECFVFCVFASRDEQTLTSLYTNFSKWLPNRRRFKGTSLISWYLFLRHKFQYIRFFERIWYKSWADMNRACLNVLVLFLVSFVVSSAAKKCTLKGFPEKMRFRVLSYNDLDHLPTDPDRKPDLETTLNTKLINSTQCRYTGK